MMLFQLCTASLLLLLSPASALLRGETANGSTSRSSRNVLSKKDRNLETVDCSRINLNRYDLTDPAVLAELQTMLDNCEDTSTQAQPGYNAQGQYVCQRTAWWDQEEDEFFQNKLPIHGCTSHVDCAEHTDKSIAEGFSACCQVGTCICGSTQSMFMPGTNKCAEFACSSSDECGDGDCIDGTCSFANIQPLCTNDASCGGDQKCYSGACWDIDSDTGLLKYNGGTGGNGGGGGGMGMRR